MADVPLFVYGTLLDEARLRSIVGRLFASVPARLDGFRREPGAAGYPTVVPCPGESVTGLLLHDVDPDALRALDAYEDEGRLYARQPATVHVDGRAVACQLYVALPRR